jgi:phage gpG-like protein
MIKAEVRLDRTSAALAALSRSVKDRGSVHRKIAIQLFGWVQKNFLERGALQNRPWAPLSEGTLKQKRRKGFSDSPLIRTGNLRSSFSGFSDNDSVGVGARASFGVDYARVHEEGSEERNIPARPMLPPREVALDIASKIYGIHLTALAQKEGLSS